MNLLAKVILAILSTISVVALAGITMYRSTLPYNENGIYFDETNAVTYNESAISAYGFQTAVFLLPTVLFWRSLINDRKKKKYAGSQKIYRIKNRKIPWGDYGSILLTGLLSKEKGIEVIERSGPFIPPIIECGFSLIVTESFKAKLESSGLEGFTFEPIRLAKMVEIRWTEWDQNRDEPAFYPESGEPEDYISEGQNNEQLRSNAEKLWKLVITNSVSVDTKQGAEWWQKIPVITRDSWKSNFAVTDKFLYKFVDEQAKNWIALNCNGNIEFEEVEVK